MTVVADAPTRPRVRVGDMDRARLVRLLYGPVGRMADLELLCHLAEGAGVDTWDLMADTSDTCAEIRVDPERLDDHCDHLAHHPAGTQKETAGNLIPADWAREVTARRGVRL